MEVVTATSLTDVKVRWMEDIVVSGWDLDSAMPELERPTGVSHVAPPIIKLAHVASARVRAIRKTEVCR